jgi:hypothetical protein
MGELRKLNLGNGKTIYVEVDDVEKTLGPVGADTSASLPNLPRGAAPISFGSKIEDAANAIHSSIDAVSTSVSESFEALKETLKPDEWTVELCW